MNESFETFSRLRLLLEIDGIGPGKILNLLSKFKSLDNLLGASYNTLISADGISTNLAQRILKRFENAEENSGVLKKEFDYMISKDINWINYWSSEYPPALRKIYAPPIVIYYTGNLTRDDMNSISIVGTRNPTIYGKEYAEKFSSELSQNGLTIVSGLARGIDSAAHRSTIQSNGRTIAVIGSGIDVIYPPENRRLFEEIENNGAVISEFPVGTKPDAPNFPKRNRIISGLSLGTLVIETDVKGGALQTAGFALNQNREVFAVPGNLGKSKSAGTNLLIQRGEAKLVTNTDDVLVELNLKIVPEVDVNIPKPKLDLNLFEQKIFDVLSNEPKHIDRIAKESSINSSECLVHLLTLEFKDIVKQLPGKSFVLSNTSLVSSRVS